MEPVSYATRKRELAGLSDATSKGNRDGIFDHLEWVGELLEQAYLAGYNRVNVAEQSPRVLERVGQPLVAARNYVKDKGFRV